MPDASKRLQERLLFSPSPLKTWGVEDFQGGILSQITPCQFILRPGERIFFQRPNSDGYGPIEILSQSFLGAHGRFISSIFETALRH